MDLSQNSDAGRFVFATAICKVSEVSSAAKDLAERFRRDNPGKDIVSVQHSTAYIPEAQLVLLTLIIEGELI